MLRKIDHQFNEKEVICALGASMLLCFKGITTEFHDIDLMIAEKDVDCVRKILSEMGELHPLVYMIINTQMKTLLHSSGQKS